MKAYSDFADCRWIGVPTDLYEGRLWDGRVKAQAAYFRREFDLDDAGAQLTIHVSAATRYRLYVNGVSLLSGPCKGDRFRHYYETLDVSEYLRSGRNVIAVKVVAYPPYDAIPDQSGHGIGPQCELGTAAGPCLIISGDVLAPCGEKIIGVGTGITPWMVSLDDAIQWQTPRSTFWMGGMEVVDAAKLPEGWIDAPMPGGTWGLADVRWPVGPDGTGGLHPFHLQPRPIPLMYEKPGEFVQEMPLRPADVSAFTFRDGHGVIPPNSHVAIELDAGVLTTAYIELPVDGGKDAKIAVRYAECYSGDTLYEKGDRADCVNFKLLGHEDIYYPCGGEETYVPFWFRTFRFVRIEVQTGEHALRLKKPLITETGYPLEYKTTFDSPDPMLNTIWEMSKRTLQRCMHETYEDCPYYEQLQYTMDTRLQMLFTYALSGDTRMALRTIDDYHASILPEGILQSRYPCQVSQVIPVFALHWIFMLEDYYEQTGDASIPRRYRPTVDNVLDWYERHVGDLGLVGQTDYWQFTDWVEKWEDKYGMSYASRVGPSTSNNLTYVLALRSAARMNRLTGRNDAAGAYDAEAEAILANIQKYCWDDSAKLYREGPGLDEYSQHAQVLAVLTGLHKDPKGLMLRTIENKDLLQCSFPWMFYFIRALEEVGLYDRASMFFDRLEGFVKLNATTIPERDYAVRSECHAWGAFPLYELPRMFLGVRMGAPGWREIIIRPYVGFVDRCSGTVTTPVGDVEVGWELVDGVLTMRGRVPDGVPCVVELPDGRRGEFVDGGVFEF